MAEISDVMPVKLFIGIIFKDEEIKIKNEVENIYGKIDYMSPIFPFEFTDYYKGEMGNNLLRRFYSFETLIVPDMIVDIKLMTNELEKKFLEENKRKVNLDPGYMDYHKIVLPSAKFGGQKVYLGKGIYGDITLWYEKGKFKPFPWTFLDFKSGLYDKVFLEMRTKYKRQIVKREA